MLFKKLAEVKLIGNPYRIGNTSDFNISAFQKILGGGNAHISQIGIRRQTGKRFKRSDKMIFAHKATRGKILNINVFFDSMC